MVSARLTPLLIVAGGLALAGCGGGTKTLSVATPPPTSPPQTSPPQTSPATTATSTQAPSGGTTAPSTTRTATEPAFTETQGGEGEAAAAAVVRAHGYTPNEPSQYHSGQALRVLVGTRTGSGDGYGQQAFFFVNGRYIGTDAKEPSATIRVVSQSDTSVTLSYPLYRRNDPLCCPGGGSASVRFELDNGRLTPAGPIPPSSRSAGLSRY